MGKFKRALRRIVILFSVIILIAGGIDLFDTINNQHRIAKTNCYLSFNDVTLTVNMTYKLFPLGVKEKVLLEKNIRGVYWNNNEDVIAVDYARNERVIGYYLLIRVPEKGLFSPYEPYEIISFHSKESLIGYLRKRDISFPSTNYYYWE